MYRVPKGTPFDKYLRRFREQVTVTVTVDGRRELPLTQYVIMRVFKSSVSRQFPALVRIVFTNEAAATSVTFADLETMRTELASLRANRTPALP